MPARSTPEKFWSRVFKRSENECWEWLGATNREGYGKLKYHQKDCQAHRMAYEFAKGPAEPGLSILHSCDNPICCNPAHLSQGTNQDNVDDRVAKGRGVRGVRKLTPEQVEEIRTDLAGKVSQTLLARKYGVCRQAINKIAHRQNWS